MSFVRTGLETDSSTEKKNLLGDRPSAVFVVIYPYKFHDFLHKLLELEQFKPYCEVIVLDISAVTTPSFAKSVTAERSERAEVLAVRTMGEFVRHIFSLRRRSRYENVCILNEIPNSTWLQTICNLIIFLTFRLSKAAILDLYNGGQPLRYRDQGFRRGGDEAGLGTASKILRFLREVSGPAEAMKKIETALFTRASRFLPNATTHRLVAGDDWVALALSKRHRRRNIVLVRGHSHDYSNHLLEAEVSPSKLEPDLGKVAVLLDGTVPKFNGDSSLLRRKVYLTTGVWYPALCKWFDAIEKEQRVQVHVAGHYKTSHPNIAPVFGNRSVHYGKTLQLVRNCEFVITIASTAISHAVIHRKPIVFIYSDQLRNDHVSMRMIRGFATMIGNEPVNIDTIDINFPLALEVNAVKYEEYERACLTSSQGSSRPNFQIILEDILNIQTENDARINVDL